MFAIGGLLVMLIGVVFGVLFWRPRRWRRPMWWRGRPLPPRRWMRPAPPRRPVRRGRRW